MTETWSGKLMKDVLIQFNLCLEVYKEVEITGT